MKMLILAQNPKIPTNLSEPLKGTKSWTMFQRWLKQAQIPEEALEIKNCIAVVGASGDVRKLARTKLRNGGWLSEVIGYPVIVCLGQVAAEAIQETRDLYFPNVSEWDHYFIPHPSGLNRKLNDPEAHQEAVNQLRCAYEKLLTLKRYQFRMKP